MHAQAEQAPNPNRRVTLGTRRDRFGLPVARVDWRPTASARTSAFLVCYRKATRWLRYSVMDGVAMSTALEIQKSIRRKSVTLVWVSKPIRNTERHGL
jgi:hypothetical protein